MRKHALDDAAALAAELGAEDAWRRATARIFGGPPGTYGTGLLQLVDVRNWRDDADLAEVYEAWGGHAYGRGLDGVEARAAMRDSSRASTSRSRTSTRASTTCSTRATTSPSTAG